MYIVTEDREMRRYLGAVLGLLLLLALAACGNKAAENVEETPGDPTGSRRELFRLWKPSALPAECPVKKRRLRVSRGKQAAVSGLARRKARRRMRRAFSNANIGRMLSPGSGLSAAPP